MPQLLVHGSEADAWAAVGVVVGAGVGAVEFAAGYESACSGGCRGGHGLFSSRCDADLRVGAGIDADCGVARERRRCWLRVGSCVMPADRSQCGGGAQIIS